ncbi:hypothetical protein ACWDX6_24115 [Streptomyces sp. NPDC003027]
MRFEIRHEGNGTVDLALDGVTLLGASGGGSEDALDCVIVGMTRADYDSLAAAMTTERARELERECTEARAQATLWKSLAERQDNTAPIRRDLRIAEAERDELKRHVEYLRYQVEALSGSAGDGDVDELEAVIISQAREIARLKGESA